MDSKKHLTLVLITLFIVVGIANAMTITVQPRKVYHVPEMGEYWVEVLVSVKHYETPGRTYTLYGYVDGTTRFKEPHSGDVNMDLNLALAKENEIEFGKIYAIEFEAVDASGEILAISNRAYVQYFPNNPPEMWTDFFATLEDARVKASKSDGYVTVKVDASGRIATPDGNVPTLTQSEWWERYGNACVVRVDATLGTVKDSKEAPITEVLPNGEWKASVTVQVEDTGVDSGSANVILSCHGNILGRKTTKFAAYEEQPQTDEEGEPATRWGIHIESPYRYDYTVDNNAIHIKIYVNYTARNACYGVRTEVEEGSCTNCYTVRIHEIIPEKGMMCAQVIREIPYVTVDIPLPRDGNEVYVTVISEIRTAPPEEIPETNALVPIECVALEAKITRLQMNCTAGECDDSVAKELNALQERYREMCGKEPPSFRPYMPEPPKETPKIILPSQLPIPPEGIREENGRIVIETGAVRVEVETNLAVSGEKVISVKSGKAVDLNVDRIVEVVKRTVTGEIAQMKLVDTGVKPIYVAEARERRRLLGFIPVNVNVRVFVDAGSGEPITVEKPWWSFLAFR